MPNNFFNISESIKDNPLFNKIQEKSKKQFEYSMCNKCSICNNLIYIDDFEKKSYSYYEFVHFGFCKECQKKKIRIGIVGSRNYQNSHKIKDFIWQSKQKFDNDLIIVSGGQKLGSDGYAKKYAIDFKIKYVEFPPRHYSYNQYCIFDYNYYNQKYQVYYYNQRNTSIVEYSNKLICFVSCEIEKSKGTFDTYKKAKKMNKTTVVCY